MAVFGRRENRIKIIILTTRGTVKKTVSFSIVENKIYYMVYSFL